MDDDVAFLLWLGELFHERGYQAFPASNARQAMALCRSPDLQVRILLANPELDDAQDAIQELLISNPGLRVILIRDTPDSGSDPIYPSIERPRPGEPISRSQWQTTIRQILLRSADT
jgi:hypothetical protein